MAENSGLTEEIEVLEAIYIHELEVQKNQSSEVTSIVLQIHPSTADDVDQQFVCMTLKLDIPQNYPDEPPDIAIKNPRGIGEEEVQSLQEDMNTLCKERIGGPMLYEVIELAKDSLTAGNIPHCACMICLEHFHEGERFTKTQCYHYFHMTCLARYVNHVHAQEPDVQVIHAKQQGNKLLCPVCREEMNYQPDSFPQSPVEDKIFFKPSSEILAMQSKMAALLEKQRAQGGIIDVEAEKNKYLVKKDDVVVLGLDTKDSEDSRSGSGSSKDGNSSKGSNAGCSTRENMSESAARDKNDHRNNQRGKVNRMERDKNRIHSGFSKGKGRDSRFESHSHSDNEVKKRSFNDRKEEGKQNWRDDNREYRNRDSKINKGNKPLHKTNDRRDKQNDTFSSSETKSASTDKEDDNLIPKIKLDVDKKEGDRIDNKNASFTSRKGFGRPKHYADGQAEHFRDDASAKSCTGTKSSDNRNRSGRNRTSPRTNDSNDSFRDNRNKSSLTKEPVESDGNCNELKNDKAEAGQQRENISVAPTNERDKKTMENDSDRKDNTPRKGFGRPSQQYDQKDSNSSDKQRHGFGRGRNYDRYRGSARDRIGPRNTEGNEHINLSETDSRDMKGKRPRSGRGGRRGGQKHYDDRDSRIENLENRNNYSDKKTEISENRKDYSDKRNDNDKGGLNKRHREEITKDDRDKKTPQHKETASDHKIDRYEGEKSERIGSGRGRGRGRHQNRQRGSDELDWRKPASESKLTVCHDGENSNNSYKTKDTEPLRQRLDKMKVSQIDGSEINTEKSSCDNNKIGHSDDSKVSGTSIENSRREHAPPGFKVTPPPGFSRKMSNDNTVKPPPGF